MFLPFIGDGVQSQIAKRIWKSFSFRYQVEKLTETAVSVVEIEIEQSEVVLLLC